MLWLENITNKRSVQVSRQAQTVSVRGVSKIEYTCIFFHVIKALCSLRHTNYTNKTHQHKTRATCHKNYFSHSKRHSIVNSREGGGWRANKTRSICRHYSCSDIHLRRGVDAKQEERWKRLRYWMATRKHCLLGTAGQLHIWTYRGCESMSKTCASPSQIIQQGERSLQHNPTPSHGAVSNC